MGLERIESRHRAESASQASKFLEELALQHAAKELSLTFLQAGRPHAIDGGDGPLHTVTEILRLARIGAYAQEMAETFPHMKVRTVVANAIGVR
jgi:hypothetical protein